MGIDYESKSKKRLIHYYVKEILFISLGLFMLQKYSVYPLLHLYSVNYQLGKFSFD